MRIISKQQIKEITDKRPKLEWARVIKKTSTRKDRKRESFSFVSRQHPLCARLDGSRWSQMDELLHHSRKTFRMHKGYSQCRSYGLRAAGRWVVLEKELNDAAIEFIREYPRSATKMLTDPSEAICNMMFQIALFGKVHMWDKDTKKIAKKETPNA